MQSPDATRLKSPVFWVFVLVLPFFVACTRSNDSFSPEIVIQKPVGAVVTRSETVVVKGYVWDDRGVAKLVAEGNTDVLPKDLRGKKMVPFQFNATLSTSKGTLELRAVDVSGRSSTRELRLNQDTQKPKISISKLEGLPDAVVISGEVSDNDVVKSIFIEGEALAFSPASRVPFGTEVRYSRSIKIEAVDRVGNSEVRYMDPPARPAPPPAPVTDTRTGLQQGTGATTPTTTVRRRRRRLRVTTPVTQPAPALPGNTRTP